MEHTLTEAREALYRAIEWATNNPADDLAAPSVWQAVDEFLEILMRKKLENPTQLNVRIEASLKARLVRESDLAEQDLSVMLRDWLGAAVSAAEAARAIPPTTTPAAEHFIESTMGDQSPPFTDGTVMTLPAAGPAPVAPSVQATATDTPGPQPQPAQQEDTANETPKE